MEDLERLVKTTMTEIERLVNTRTLVGDPIVVGDNTLIPLISVGFGFGAGFNSGISTNKQKGEMSGAASGGGAGIKPVAVIVASSEGVKLERVTSSVSGAIDKITDMAPKVIEKIVDVREEKKEEKKEI
ncbi:MAG: sporulation protein YtfJ [Dehalococcoidales bacterium]|jgi:uncharacterized spore protein YtfJ|nr:sporulation protein YtfJ [Dehalococcoidales bacterium]